MKFTPLHDRVLIRRNETDDPDFPAVVLDFLTDQPDTSPFDAVIQTGKPLLIVAEDVEGSISERAVLSSPRLVILDEPASIIEDLFQRTAPLEAANAHIPTSTPEWVSLGSTDPGVANEMPPVDWVDDLRSGDEGDSLLFALGNTLTESQPLVEFRDFIIEDEGASTDDEGQHTSMFGNYRPQFYFRSFSEERNGLMTTNIENLALDEPKTIGATVDDGDLFGVV